MMLMFNIIQASGLHNKLLTFRRCRRLNQKKKLRLQCFKRFFASFFYLFLWPSVFAGFPQPIAIYALDQKTRARDISPGKNIPGRSYNIRYAPGPYGQPRESTEFLGRRNSYIRFPNRGRLDTKKSISLLAWVLPLGPGPIFEQPE